jgi:hypothetical protein
MCSLEQSPIPVWVVRRGTRLPNRTATAPCRTAAWWLLRKAGGRVREGSATVDGLSSSGPRQRVARLRRRRRWYGTTDVTMSSTVRERLGVAYCATAAFHCGRATPLASACTAAAFIGLALARSTSRRPEQRDLRHRIDGQDAYAPNSDARSCCIRTGPPAARIELPRPRMPARPRRRRAHASAGRVGPCPPTCQCMWT